MMVGSSYEDWRDEADARIGVARLEDGTELVPKTRLDAVKQQGAATSDLALKYLQELRAQDQTVDVAIRALREIAEQAVDGYPEQRIAARALKWIENPTHSPRWHRRGT